jgi:hypothetical protein
MGKMNILNENGGFIALTVWAECKSVAIARSLSRYFVSLAVGLV